MRDRAMEQSSVNLLRSKIKWWRGHGRVDATENALLGLIEKYADLKERGDFQLEKEDVEDIAFAITLAFGAALRSSNLWKPFLQILDPAPILEIGLAKVYKIFGRS